MLAVPFYDSFVVVRILWSERGRLEWMQGEGLRQLLLEFFRGCYGGWQRLTETSKLFPKKTLGLKDTFFLPSDGHSLSVPHRELPALVWPFLETGQKAFPGVPARKVS